MLLIAGVDSVLGDLGRLRSNPSLPSPLTDQIKNLQLELRFIKMFFWCFDKWDDAALDARLGPVVTQIADQLRKAGQGLYAAGLIAIHRGQTEKWDMVTSNLLERVKHVKPQISEICIDMLGRSLDCSFAASYEILDFISTILENLKHIVSSNANFMELEEILRFLRGFVEFSATRAVMYEELEDFWNHVQGFVNKASCVSFLFWVWEGGDIEIDNVPSDLLKMIEPFSPEVIEMYLGVLKASKSSGTDTTLIGQVVANFVDSLLKNLQVSMKDYIAVLGEGLFFLIMVLMDPAELREKGGSSIVTEIDALVSDIASFLCCLCVDQTRNPQNIILPEFLQRIDKVKAEIKEYVEISRPSVSDFPKTNGLGIFDFLLEKIEMLNCDGHVSTFAKSQIVTIQKELLSLQSLLKQRSEQNELEDIWEQIISVAYRAEHVVDSSLIMDAPIWHNMVQLSDVIAQMKLIKQKNLPVLSHDMRPKIDLSEEAKISSIHVVGLEDDTQTIINKLTRGSRQLEIVSIVGMPGIGKTTLAMKVFDSPSIKQHFDIRLWCHVSRVHNRRKSMLSILECILGGDKFSEWNDELLADKVRFFLKSRRFFIVLDEIWDLEAWHEIRSLLSDDNCGSRVLLTTRIRGVGDLYILHPLSDEESLELLCVKLFQGGVCPLELLAAGKMVVRNCEGLPLAIVLIAGVLAKKGKDLHFWQQIAQSMNSYIASEGYMKIIEYSYKHVPDVLKSCFLYFATFQNETVIKVKRLVRLWIAEGFIPKTVGKSQEDVANEYLMDLVSRNLVIVASRSFDGRIKECQVHGLLHDFCETKGEEEGFLQLVNKTWPCDPYRLCIPFGWSSFVNSKLTGPNLRSLLFRPYDSSEKYPNVQIFNRFKLLRVLDLEGLQLGLLFPQELTSLVCLTYLSVTGGFTFIPSAIGNLSYIQTLHVRSYDSIIALPNTIWKMKSLRHVEIPFGATFSFDDCDLEKSTPLHNVVTFTSLYISRKEGAEMLRRMLPNVRRLRFQFYNQFSAQLDLLDDLEALSVRKVGRASFTFSPQFPSSVRKLALLNLRLPWDKMSAIAKLPNLQVLKLLSKSFEGLCWDIGEDEFRRLRFLKLEGLDISKWNMRDGSLSFLERLVVKNCVKLLEIPRSFTGLCRLKIIEVSECSSSVAESARIIVQEQYEMGNEDIQVTITTKVAEEHSSPFGKKRKKGVLGSPSVSSDPVSVSALAKGLVAEASADDITSITGNSEGETVVAENDLKHLLHLLDGKDGEMAWQSMMERSMSNLAFQAWRHEPEMGPLVYRSRTVFEDATPELVRDFFCDDEFRSKWDPMLLYFQILEECPLNGTVIVHWIKKFPFFCSDREYIIGRRIWEAGKMYYCVTKGVPYPRLPRREKPRRVDLYFSSWVIKPVQSLKGDGQLSACEVTLIHYEDIGIPKDIAKLGVRQGMWGTVKKLHAGFRAYQNARESEASVSRCALMARTTTKISSDEEGTESLKVKSSEEDKNETMDINSKRGGGEINWRWVAIGVAVATVCGMVDYIWKMYS